MPKRDFRFLAAYAASLSKGCEGVLFGVPGKCQCPSRRMLQRKPFRRWSKQCCQSLKTCGKRGGAGAQQKGQYVYNFAHSQTHTCQVTKSQLVIQQEKERERERAGHDPVQGCQQRADRHDLVQRCQESADHDGPCARMTGRPDHHDLVQIMTAMRAAS